MAEPKERLYSSSNPGRWVFQPTLDTNNRAPESNHLKKTQALQNSIEILTETFAGVATPNRDYVVLDYPDYSNVGDSAIYLGELELLYKVFDRGPSFVCSKRTFHGQVGGPPGDRVIFLQGGGNFGDLWPSHQSFREMVIERFPNHRIVQLPQSIHFNREENLAECARMIESHRDFTLFVRDQESYELAHANFSCETRLCPDAALALGALERPTKPDIPVLCMMRLDQEGTFSEAQTQEIAKLGPVEDWLEDTPGMRSVGERLLEKSARKFSFSRPGLDRRLTQVFDRWAAARLARGISQLSRAEFVVTDRLHVHVLCSLMGISHAVFDNSYGKITRFIEAWPGDGIGTVVRNFDEVHHLLEKRSNSFS